MNPWGWLACCCVLASMYLTGNRNRVGFLVGIIAELLWIAYAYAIGSVELGSMAIVYILVYGRNFYRWGQPTTPTSPDPPTTVK